MARLSKLETRIRKLEALFPGLPGTIFQRVLMDNNLCLKEGITPTGRESTTAWSVGFGAPWSPKQFFFGATLGDAVSKAEKGLVKNPIG